ncbi:MAG: hypothetical protein SFU56_17770 [Capsulimonadales bacterium]|nr:hypothetical protein [Capsulimonadales bacterium]
MRSPIIVCGLFVVALLTPGTVSAQPPNITGILRENAAQAYRFAQAGDTANYRLSITRIRTYVRSVYPAKNADRGWKEMASDQLAIGDRDGAKETALLIRDPRLRASAFTEIGRSGKDRDAFANALKASLLCAQAEEVARTLQDLVREQVGAGHTEDALLSLRAGAQRLRKPATGQTEEHRRSALRRIADEQTRQKDFAGAIATARLAGDAEQLALTAVARFREGDASGCQATFQEAIRVAKTAAGDRKAYFLERITYSLLDIGAVESARGVALTVPFGPPPIAGHHREKALRSVVFALADSGDIANAKAIAGQHRQRDWYVYSWIRISENERTRGNAQAARQTLASVGQRMLQYFPNETGQERGLHYTSDKVNGLIRIAFLQHLRQDETECLRTLALARRVADAEREYHPKNSALKEIIGMQAMCGYVREATAAAQPLPAPFREQAMAQVRKASENRRHYASGLNSQCLDPRLVPRL